MAKRILIYTNHFYPENFKVNEIAALFAEENFEVQVVTGTPNYPAGKTYEGYGYFKRSKEKAGKVSVRRLPLIPRGSGSGIRLIFNYLSYFLSTFLYTVYLTFFKKKYDVVFVHHTSPIFIAISPIFYKWFRRPKMILWDLDMWPDTLVAMGVVKSEKVASILEKLVSWIYNRYDHILVGSRSFVAKAKKRVEEKKIEYFPNWAERVFVEGKLNSPTKDLDFPLSFNIMYAGNIGKAQDFKNVFKAMKLLQEESVNWLLIGDGREREWLEEQVKKEGMFPEVIFYGNNKLETMPYFFSQADLMFFSLKDEEIFSRTVPAKLQAYMASGKPVIGMINGEGAEIIEQARCGFVVPSGDYKKLAEVILEAHNMSHQALEALGANGKVYYEEHFSIDKRREQLMSLVMDRISF